MTLWRCLEVWWLRPKKVSQTPKVCHHRSSCSKWWEVAWTLSFRRLTMTNENRTCWIACESCSRRRELRTSKNWTEKMCLTMKSRTLTEQFKRTSSFTPCWTVTSSLWLELKSPRSWVWCSTSTETTKVELTSTRCISVINLISNVTSSSSNESSICSKSSSSVFPRN